jgi:hypothetical protein
MRLELRTNGFSPLGPAGARGGGGQVYSSGLPALVSKFGVA